MSPHLQDGGGTGKLRLREGSRCWELGWGVLLLGTAPSQVNSTAEMGPTVAP